MSDAPAYDAFLLAGFGGPERSEDVMPFLENVTRGRDIPRERLDTVSHHYLALGGASPINDQNRALLAALGAELRARGIDLPLYWGNRNWEPYLGPALRRIAEDGHRRVLAMATSAYASYSGCRQYREDLARALDETGLLGTIAVAKLRLFFDDPGFIGPFADGLTVALERLAEAGVDPGTTRIFFTTHSIPLSMAAASGPPGRFDPNGAYVAQHQVAVGLVLDAVRARGMTVPEHALVYQSRSGGPHVPWLEPDINDALRAAHLSGMRAAIVVPIGFISDHVEVIWDLDHEARQTCHELGVRMERVPTPGVQPAFVSGIVDLILERMDGRQATAASTLGPWPPVCAVGCCANLRRDLPTVAGEDSIAGGPTVE